MSFARTAEPKEPHLNDAHPSPIVDDSYLRDSVARGRSFINFELAQWLISHEARVQTHSEDQPAAPERVFQQLSLRLSRLISPTGSQAILSRALRFTETEFPLLKGVRAGPAHAACLEGLPARGHDVDADDETNRALVAVLSTVFDLLVGFIGEDLTFRLVREIWLGVPFREPRRPVDSADAFPNPASIDYVTGRATNQG